MLCPRCNYALTAQFIFCPRCGQQVENAPAPAAAQSGTAGPFDTVRLDTRQEAGAAPSHSAPASLYPKTTPATTGAAQSTPADSHGSSLGSLWLWGIFAVLFSIFLTAALRPSPKAPGASTAAPSAVAETQAGSTGAMTPAEEAPPVPAIPRGPAFEEIDGVMSDRRNDITDAQREVYWNTVAGTLVTWRGQVNNVTLGNGGQINLRCNPNSLLSDTRCNLDGSQSSLLSSIQKGQMVTIEGILRGHGITGYTLGQGRIVG